MQSYLKIKKNRFSVSSAAERLTVNQNVPSSNLGRRASVMTVSGENPHEEVVKATTEPTDDQDT